MAKKKFNGTWESLRDPLRESLIEVGITKEDWEQAHARTVEYTRQERIPSKPPAGWVEPSMTLAEMEAEGSFEGIVAYMRAQKKERITRTEYFELAYSGVVPKPWHPEFEAELPSGLQDKYMTINPKLKREKTYYDDL